MNICKTMICFMLFFFNAYGMASCAMSRRKYEIYRLNRDGSLTFQHRETKYPIRDALVDLEAHQRSVVPQRQGRMLPTIQDVQPICSLSQRRALQQQRYKVGERFTQQRVLMREKRQVYEQLLNGLQQNSDDNVYKLNVIEAKRDLERCTATLLSLERWLLSFQK